MFLWVIKTTLKCWAWLLEVISPGNNCPLVKNGKGYVCCSILKMPSNTDRAKFLKSLIWTMRVFINLCSRRMWIFKPSFTGGCPLCVMVKAMDCGNRNKRDRTPVTLWRSLSVKYPWERYEPPYPPSYGLNSTTSVLLTLLHSLESSTLCG